MSSSKIIGAIEIGTSKVTVLIAEVSNGRSLNIIGRGQSTAMGMRKGDITSVAEISNCTHAAILNAEKQADTQIECVYLSQSGGHLDGFSHSGTTSVSGPDQTVSEADIRRVIENAKEKVLPPGRVFIHHIQSGFLLDGKFQNNPLGMRGTKLEVLYWHVHGDERKLSDRIRVINGYGLEVNDIIISSIASGTILTSEIEKKQGVLVVDIGCGTTDFALYKNGRVLRSGVIPVGGDHLTNDLSLGLRVNAKRAESLKVRYGKAIIDKDDKEETVMLVGDLMIGDRPIPRLAIYKILQARVEEIFMILKNKLGSAISVENLPGGVVLTGGVAKLPYITLTAEHTLKVPVRLGESPEGLSDSELKHPEYSTVLGLLYYGLRGQNSEEYIPSTKSSGWIAKVKGIFS